MSEPGEIRQDALDSISDDELYDALSVQRVSSLRDIQALYGGLFSLATSDGGKYAKYLTPHAGNDWLGDDETVVAVRVDASNAAGNPSAVEYAGIHVTSHSPDLIGLLAHSKYPPGQGRDHSITHQTGQSADPDGIAGFAVERLTNWPAEAAVQSVAQDDSWDDGWLVSALAELGEDETVHERITADITERVARDEGAFVTVQVRLDSDEEWLWPGEIDFFLEATRRLRRDRLRSKNLDGDNTSSGRGVCLVTRESEEVFGTADDPFKAYLTKQMEKFNGFEPTRAWTNHSISAEAALDVMSATPFLEACRVSAFRGEVYHLPYFPGRVTADRARILYFILADLVSRDDDGNAPTARALKIAGENADDLRFHSLVVQREQKERWNVLGEGRAVDTIPLAEIAEAHDAVVSSQWFGSGTTSTFYPGDDSPFFDTSGQKTIDSVASGGYLWPTFPDRERKKSPSHTDIRVDDPRVQAFNALIDGSAIEYETLLGWYVDRLVEETDLSSEGESFPYWHVIAQFAQLCALATAGLVVSRDGVPVPTLELIEYTPLKDGTMPSESHSDARTASSESDDESAAKSAPAQREEKLTAFIESHPPLRDEVERRGAFLVGVLVGHVSTLQQDRGRTIVDAHPITGVSKHTLGRVATNALHKNEVYATERGYTQMFGEVTTQLSDALQYAPPEEWELSTEAIRFHYALGIAYGKNAGRTDN